MSTYDKTAEEEWYRAAKERTDNEWEHHLRQCVTCDLNDNARCRKGDHLEGLVIMANENLRKVKLKNKLY